MKTKISAFEFAIMQTADAKEAEKHEPYTKEEEKEIRINRLKQLASQITITTGNK